MKDNEDNAFMRSEMIRLSQDTELINLPESERINELERIATLILSKLERTKPYGTNS